MAAQALNEYDKHLFALDGWSAARLRDFLQREAFLLDTGFADVDALNDEQKREFRDRCIRMSALARALAEKTTP